MPSTLSEKDVQVIREDLLRLRNAMYDLRADGFAMVCKKAEVALGELLDMVKKGRDDGDRKALGLDAEPRKCTVCQRSDRPLWPDGRCDTCEKPVATITLSGCGHTVKVSEVLCPICGV